MSLQPHIGSEQPKTAAWVNDTGWELPTPGTEREHRAKYPADWARYEFAAERARGKRVLDCATGPGFGAWLLATSGAAHVIGVDNSPDAIDWSKRHFSVPNVEFIQVDAGKLPIEKNSLDLVVSFETIEHIAVDAVPRFVETLAGVLKQGGTMILSTPLNLRPDRLAPSNRFHVREYNDEELAQLLTPHFDVVERFGQHSPGSSRFSALKRTFGVGALVRSGLHRFMPESARSQFRNLLGRARPGKPASWITRENWRDAPVQIVVAIKR